MKKNVMESLEDLLGCKWSLRILGTIHDGIHRPGAINRTIDGLSTKVMNDRLSKMLRFGILEKEKYPEIPPRVEYRLTNYGKRISKIIREIKELQEEVSDCW